jgi:two-component system sensor histidine kinase AtoS
MKKKIVIIFVITTTAFLLSGGYIISTIEKTTSELDTLIKLHQVEIMRENLLIRIKRVQSDLSLRTTRFARGVDIIVKDVAGMQQAVEVCFGCHHSPEVTERLEDLRSQVKLYRDSLSRVLTIRANARRLDAEEEHTFRTGEELISKVNTMISLTSAKLTGKTESALSEISKTKFMLFILVSVGPFLAAGLAVLIIRGVTRPVHALLDATRKIKGGDLDYRVGALKDEFAEVAASFNDMAVSLKEHLIKVEENEKRYRALFERAGDAIFIIDSEGKKKFQIVAANPAAATMHGYTVDELLGLKITDLDAPESSGQAPLFAQRILRGEWVTEQTYHIKKDGTVFPLEVSAGVLDLGNHKYILAFDRDITERRQAEEALQRTEQLKVVGELAAGLAHEIKNPLSGIKASMEVLSEEAALSEEDRGILIRVVSEIKRIELLLKGLLNFTRPPKPQFTTVNVNALLDTSLVFSLKNTSSSPDASGPITIVKKFDERLPETMADPMQLQQVFMNILINAADAMREGGTLTVQTGFQASEEAIEIMISDTGRGMDKTQMENIFLPFFTTKPKGSGLGLSITKRLIEQHGGSLRVESVLGKGSTFTIALPVRRVPEVQFV